MNKYFKFIFILLIGPVCTIGFIYMGKSDPNLFELLIQALIMISISICVAIAIKKVIKMSIISIPLSTILSIVCFVSLLYFFTYFIAEGKDRAEWIMWLPVARLFLIIYGFPTALSVSFAVIKTYKKIGISQSNTD